jgi:hypothetical protein
MIIIKTKKIKMAISKKVENKVKGYFFMSINNDVINVDMAGDDTSLAAAFGMLLTSKAKSNADIADAFQLFRDNLIVGSPEMEKFLNRYFSNDTVVV